MAKVTFNEHGEMINAETGEKIGTGSNGKIVIDSNGSRTFTLEDYGVSVPEPTEEEIEAERKKEASLDEAVSEDEEKSPSSENSSEESRPSIPVSSSHTDSGESSFPVKRTKYEVTPESYFIVRFGIVQDPDDGRIIPIKIDSAYDFKNSELHWVKFRMWNYSEEISWKEKATEYNQKLRSQYINDSRLNEIKIKNLLLDWSFSKEDERLHLLHCNGVLSDESYSVFMSLYPSIASTITEMMNSVLENNQ